MDDNQLIGLPAYRTLYALIVVRLTYHPLDAMYIMAFFIWLQQLTCLDHLISTVSCLASTGSIQLLIDEVIMCLRYFHRQQPSSRPELNGIPRIEALTLSRVTFRFLLAAGEISARESIRAILHGVCYPLFQDLMNVALAHMTTTTTTEILVFPQQSPACGALPSSSNNRPSSRLGLPLPSTSSRFMSGQQVLSHQARSRTPTINDVATVNQLRHIHPAGSSSSSSSTTSISNSHHHRLNLVHPDDRTLFATFSRGHPVGKDELIHLMNSLIGADAYEEVVMKPPMRLEEQVLCAIVVLHDPRTINQILKGSPKVKHHVNGKHVILRKFIRKEEYRHTVPQRIVPRAQRTQPSPAPGPRPRLSSTAAGGQVTYGDANSQMTAAESWFDMSDMLRALSMD